MNTPHHSYTSGIKKFLLSYLIFINALIFGNISSACSLCERIFNCSNVLMFINALVLWGASDMGETIRGMPPRRSSQCLISVQILSLVTSYAVSVRGLWSRWTFRVCPGVTTLSVAQSNGINMLLKSPDFTLESTKLRLAVRFCPDTLGELITLPQNP